MKKEHLFLVFSLLIFGLKAQQGTFQWAKAEGKYAYDYGYGIGTDAAGNLYVAGKYEENLAVFSTTTVPCAGNHDSYLAKYSPSGGLIWIRTAGGVHGDYAESMAMGSNFVVISGEIEGAGDVITFPGSTITLTAYGDNDIFFAKYDLEGNLLWAKSEGTYKSYSEKGLAVAVDGSDNIFVGGYFTDTTRVNGTLVAGKGGRDIYVAKYDKDGNFQWIKTAGSAGRDEVKNMKCDPSGNVYLTGMISKNAVFESQTVSTYNNTNYFDSYIAKYSSSGALQWVKTGGGDYDDVGWSMTMDNAGKIFIAGEFNAYAVFGHPDYHLTTGGAADVFVACYDANGNTQWVQRAGGSGQTIDRARGIGCDGDNLFITGQFGLSASFGSMNLTAADSSDIFIAALDNGGHFQWALAVGGNPDQLETLGYESGNAICSKNGEVYATGGILNDQVGGTNLFGTFTIPGYAHTDAFIAKIASVTGIGEQLAIEPLGIYPNPGNGHFTLSRGDVLNKGAVSVYNGQGQLVLSAVNPANGVIDLGNQADGIYLIEVQATDKLMRSKIVLQH